MKVTANDIQLEAVNGTTLIPNTSEAKFGLPQVVSPVGDGKRFIINAGDASGGNANGGLLELRPGASTGLGYTEINFMMTDPAWGATNIVSVFPPEQNSAYIKATTTEEGHPYLITDPSKSVIGAADTWLASGINQRFHIDCGRGRVITKIYYENYHINGINVDYGAKDFTFWGSNDPTAFDDLVYGHDTNWTQLTTSQSTFDQHPVGNNPDPKYITVTNTDSYQFYAFKIVTQWGGPYKMGLRRIQLQEVGDDTLNSFYTVGGFGYDGFFVNRHFMFFQNNVTDATVMTDSQYGGDLDGNALTVKGGNAGTGGVDHKGGTLRLEGGQSTGHAAWWESGGIEFYVSDVGTTGNTPNDLKMIGKFRQDGLEIFSDLIFFNNSVSNASVAVDTMYGEDLNGGNLTIQSGDAGTGGTNHNAGQLILQTGQSTGTGEAYIEFKVTKPGATGNTQNPQITVGYIEPTGVDLESPSDTEHRVFRTMRYRDAGTNLTGGEYTGEVRFTGLVNSLPETQATIIGAYSGNGTTKDGSLKLAIHDGTIVSTMLELKPETILMRGLPAIVPIATVSSIDATATGVTLLYTVPTGKSLVITKIIVRCTAFTVGSKSVQATANFGTNATNYDNFLNGYSSTIAQLGAYNEAILSTGAVSFITLSASDVLYVKVTTASDATAEGWTIDIFGYFV